QIAPNHLSYPNVSRQLRSCGRQFDGRVHRLAIDRSDYVPCLQSSLFSQTSVYDLYYWWHRVQWWLPSAQRSSRRTSRRAPILSLISVPAKYQIRGDYFFQSCPLV